MEHRDSQYTVQDPGSGAAAGSIGAVREEAKEQVRSVADTAVRETKGVLADMGSDLSREAQSQKLRLAKGLDGFSTELEEVALNGSGRVPSLASEAAARTRGLARWLERTDPSDMVRSVEDFGRRRPVTFVLGSLVAGVLAGRVTRGMIDGRAQDAPSTEGPTSQRYVQPGYAPGDDFGTSQSYPTPSSPVAHVGAGSFSEGAS
jgi:hypothetical protein